MSETSLPKGSFIKQVGDDLARPLFICVDDPCSLSEQGVPSTGGRGWELDPLAGDKTGRHWWAEPTERFEKIEIPYQGSFPIDSVEEFKTCLTWDFRRKDHWWESFAINFLSKIREFCRANALMDVGASEKRIQSGELSELGLDFFRQHYRWIKRRAIREETVPETSELMRWLYTTRANRTSDSFWSWDRDHHEVLFCDEPTEMAVNVDNYPLIPTTHSMHLAGSGVVDLEPLASSMRLAELTLRDVAAKDLGPLGERSDVGVFGAGRHGSFIDRIARPRESREAETHGM